jgi:hypothetical protein
MAGLINIWTYDTPSFAGKTVYRYALSGSKVSVVFLRLASRTPDGVPYPASADDPYRPGNTSLWLLWTGQVQPIPVIGTWSSPEAGISYSGTEITNVLAALMTAFAPTNVATLDGTGVSDAGEDFFNGYQHNDPFHVGKYAFDAHLDYPAKHQFTIYRDYNIESQPKNLSSDENVAKWSTFSTYAAYDSALYCGSGGSCAGNCTQECYGEQDWQYPAWTWAQYPIRQITDTSGWIAGPGGKCLEVDVPAQKWTLRGNQVQAAGTSECLGLQGSASADGTPAQLQTCGSGASQGWTLADNGLLRGVRGECLDVSNIADGAGVRIDPCARQTVQKMRSLPRAA